MTMTGWVFDYSSLGESPFHSLVFSKWGKLIGGANLRVGSVTIKTIHKFETFRIYRGHEI